MKRYQAYSLALLLIVSCSSKKDKNFVESTDSDLVKSFNLSKNKEFAKFEVTSIPEQVPPSTPKVEEVKQEIVEVRDQVRIKVKKVKKIVKKIEPKKEVKKEVIKPLYPAKFPTALKKYDKNSETFWRDFKPHIYEGENFVFKVSYMGLTAGHVKMVTEPSVQVAGRPAYRLKAFLRSAQYYSYIYKLDDSLESLVDRELFLPIKYSMYQRESGQTVDDLQIFDHEKLKTFVWYKRLKKGKIKKFEKEESIPRYFQDSYSALYFVRGFPLNMGDEYQVPIVTRGKIWLLKLKVDGFEKIEIMDENISAIRIKAETHFPGVLKKRGDIIFWYSNDKVRKLLKFSAKVKIGAVQGELVEYHAGSR